MPAAEADELDPRIVAFGWAAPDWYGAPRWKPESALPVPKAELHDLLVSARRGLDPREKLYRRLSDLLLKLVFYVPDSDVEALRPFLTESGAISGRRPRSASRRQEYERVVRLFERHRAEADRLLTAAGIEDTISGNLVEEEDSLGGTAFGYAYMLFTFWKWVPEALLALPRALARALARRR